MTPREQLEILLYRSKLNQTSIIEILPLLSSKTVLCILKDFQDNTTENNTTESIYVFTDGNCKSNGRKGAKAGYAVFFTEDEDSTLFNLNYSGHVITDPTNQKAELAALSKLFQIINDNPTLFAGKTIVVCTDSMYSIKCITEWSKKWVENNWKTAKGESVKNANLIKNILDAKLKAESSNVKIDFKHVFSHTVQPTDTQSLQYKMWRGNYIVDAMINNLLSKD